MSQSILLNSMISPVRAAMRTSTPRSILRRPSALPLSPTPFPFHSNFSVMVSPSMKSPHVQFMASPQLVATFTTHSSEAYDRAPIKVSPNPLALPRRGDRYYSPSVENFKLADAPKPKAAVQKRLDSILRNSQECASPAITEFEDPRSPKAQVANTQQQQVVRFASFAELPERSPQDLSKSIHSYPRSPYPSATEFLIEERGRGMDESAMSEPLATKTRSQSVEGTAPRKAKAPTRGPASFKPMPSPLQQSFNVPLTAGLQRSHKPAPLALEPQVDTGALNEAFWNAVSLEVVESPMVTALEYPAPADDLEDIDLESSEVAALKSPGLMFANQNGEVWSPSAGAKTSGTVPRESLLRDALMSPGKVAFGRVKRSLIASPTPHDPFASFPSFSAVLSLEPTADSTITYPAPAVVAD